MASADNLLAEQGRRNRESRDAWSAFTAHRARVMQLLIEAAAGRQQPALCLLGAGNCNDVDLSQLLPHYAAIRLVDCDAPALNAAVDRQGLASNPAIVLQGNVDLLGPPMQGLGPFDVVASLCVLSQLVDAATQLLGNDPQSPQTLELVRAIRHRHLTLLVELLRPDGCGLLITDLVSSETVPHLQTLPQSQLASVIAHCLATKNFFTGLNPAVVLDVLQRDPWFTARITVEPPLGPWIWDLGPRQYAVYALRLRRRI